VREFVSKEATALQAVWCESALIEDDVIANRECVCPYGLG
jgi:hypothetical protein